MKYVYNPSTWESEARGPRVWGHPWLDIGFKASQEETNCFIKSQTSGLERSSVGEVLTVQIQGLEPGFPSSHIKALTAGQVCYLNAEVGGAES